MTNNERLAHMKAYLARLEKVKVEIKPNVRQTNQGTITSRFNGDRIGYKFVEGVAYVERKDLSKFKNLYPEHLIIHDPFADEEEQGIQGTPTTKDGDK